MGIVLPITIGPTLTIRPWIDPVVDQHGHDALSYEVETDWLPVLGPTATWLYRRLGGWAAAYPDGLDLDTATLAQSLGLGTSIGPGCKLDRALQRLVRFGVVSWSGGDLKVRRSLSAPPKRKVDTTSRR